jgi:hypothetical protein
MQAQTVTLIVALAGIAGTFGSGFFTQRMARSSQHEQWLRDNRKQEYRELLTSLSTAYMHLEQNGSDSTDLRHHPVRNEAFRTLLDRIFIDQEIKKEEIYEEWSRLWDIHNQGPQSTTDAGRLFKSLTSKLGDMARNDPRKFR